MDKSFSWGDEKKIERQIMFVILAVSSLTAKIVKLAVNKISECPGIF